MSDPRAALAVAGAAILAGWLGGLHVRGAERVRPPAPPVQRAEELAALLAQAKNHRQVLEAELARLRARLREYEQLSERGQALTRALEEEIRLYRMVVGLEPVRGPGLELVIRPGAAPSLPVPAEVGALDLAGLVNELWASGAEAVAVNGRRVSSHSAYRQKGSWIVVDGVRLRSPYVVQAVGPADAMEGALRVPGGFLDGLGAVGVDVRIQRRPDLRLPESSGPPRFRWGVPDR